MNQICDIWYIETATVFTQAPKTLRHTHTVAHFKVDFIGSHSCLNYRVRVTYIDDDSHHHEMQCKQTTTTTTKQSSAAK